MAGDPIWLTPADLVDIHDHQLRLFGGAAGLKSLPLLESAAAAPVNLRLYGGEADLLRLAAQLANAIVRNHPFVDGNKRTATVALIEFLYLHGLVLELADLPEAQPLAELVERLAAGRIGAAEFATALRPFVHPRET